jgi:hypothetical protein
MIARIMMELERRFPRHDPIIRAVAHCYSTSEDFLNPASMQPLIHAYNIKGDISSEIVVFKNILRNKNVQPTSLPEMLMALKPKEGFPALTKLLQLVLTIPVANVAVERSFSTLRRTRNYLRTKMGEERLSSLAMMSIERELAQDIDLEKVIDKFSKLPHLRLNKNVECEVGKRRLNLHN